MYFWKYIISITINDMIYDDPKVNDMSLVGMTHDEAVDVIKTSTSPLTLTLQTPIKQGTHCSYTL